MALNQFEAGHTLLITWPGVSAKTDEANNNRAKIIQSPILCINHKTAQIKAANTNKEPKTII